MRLVVVSCNEKVRKRMNGTEIKFSDEIRSCLMICLFINALLLRVYGLNKFANVYF